MSWPEGSQLERLRQSFINAQVLQTFGCTGFGLEGALGSCGHFHRGVDLFLPREQGFDYNGHTASPLYSPVSGRVVWAGMYNRNPAHGGYSPGGNLGNMVEIIDPHGLTWLFGHLRGTTGQVRAGDLVRAGQLIGTQGGMSSDPGHGASTGEHLHLEIRRAIGGPNAREFVDFSPGYGSGQPIGNINTRRYRDNIWYTIYHSLGFGQGYNPGQAITEPPDPGGPPLFSSVFPNLPVNPGVGDPVIPGGGGNVGPPGSDNNPPGVGDPGGNGVPVSETNQCIDPSADGTCPSGYYLLFSPFPGQSRCAPAGQLGCAGNNAIGVPDVLGGVGAALPVIGLSVVGLLVVWNGLRSLSKDKGAPTIVTAPVAAVGSVGSKAKSAVKAIAL